jgi:hypothetical protein
MSNIIDAWRTASIWDRITASVQSAIALVVLCCIVPF